MRGLTFTARTKPSEGALVAKLQGGDSPCHPEPYRDNHALLIRLSSASAGPASDYLSAAEA
jgi:hypothetical protein